MRLNIHDRFNKILPLICCSVVLVEQRFFFFIKSMERKCFPCAHLRHRSMAPPFQLYKSQLCFQLRVTCQIPFTLCTWTHKRTLFQWFIHLCVIVYFIIYFILNTCITCISYFFLCAIFFLCKVMWCSQCIINKLEVHCGCCVCCVAYSKGREFMWRGSAH